MVTFTHITRLVLRKQSVGLLPASPLCLMVFLATSASAPIPKPTARPGGNTGTNQQHSHACGMVQKLLYHSNYAAKTSRCLNDPFNMKLSEYCTRFQMKWYDFFFLTTPVMYKDRATIVSKTAHKEIILILTLCKQVSDKPLLMKRSVSTGASCCLVFALYNSALYNELVISVREFLRKQDNACFSILYTKRVHHW